MGLYGQRLVLGKKQAVHRSRACLDEKGHVVPGHITLAVRHYVEVAKCLITVLALVQAAITNLHSSHISCEDDTLVSRLKTM